LREAIVAAYMDGFGILNKNLTVLNFRYRLLAARGAFAVSAERTDASMMFLFGFGMSKA
jgi:hypothetical protein